MAEIKAALNPGLRFQVNDDVNASIDANIIASTVMFIMAKRKAGRKGA